MMYVFLSYFVLVRSIIFYSFSNGLSTCLALHVFVLGLISQIMLKSVGCDEYVE